MREKGLQDYIPLYTEMQGCASIVGGVGYLGMSGILKIRELYTGQKVTIPCLAIDAVEFNADIGIGALKHGVRQLLPTAAIALAVYTCYNRVFS